MAYKKPQMIAKASAKKSYAAGCPQRKRLSDSCFGGNAECFTGPLH